MKQKILIGAGVVVFLCVATFALATHALPGGPLYGVKTGVIEKVEATFAGSQGRDLALWQLKLAERRLEEAAKAAKKGKLTADAHETILASFNDQMKGIEEYIGILQAEGNPADIKDFTVTVGQALAREADVLATTQVELRSAGKEDRAATLDFLIRRVSNAVVAAATIAASTLVEDSAPVSDVDPSTVDEWGHPIQ